jgi:hypothetical protein
MLDEFDFAEVSAANIRDRFPKGNNNRRGPRIRRRKLLQGFDSVNQALRDLAAIIQRQSDKARPYMIEERDRSSGWTVLEEHDIVVLN